jgi:carbon-monoxide dehydrogenase small subunit
VTTIEGLGGPAALDPVQAAFAEVGAFECGFCTTGMIVAARALLDRVPSPDRAAIVEFMSGNLCRCTGYADIIRAIELAASDPAAPTPGARA